MSFLVTVLGQFSPFCSDCSQFCLSKFIELSKFISKFSLNFGKCQTRRKQKRYYRCDQPKVALKSLKYKRSVPQSAAVGDSIYFRNSSGKLEPENLTARLHRRCHSDTRSTTGSGPEGFVSPLVHANMSMII